MLGEEGVSGESAADNSEMSKTINFKNNGKERNKKSQDKSLSHCERKNEFVVLLNWNEMASGRRPKCQDDLKWFIIASEILGE